MKGQLNLGGPTWRPFRFPVTELKKFRKARRASFTD